MMITGCPINPDQLSHVNVPYFGLDHEQHAGILVVNKNVAQEIQQIFATLDQAHFPIAKIKPLSDYNNEDEALADNDTFAFSCRYILRSTKLSKHSFGIAIDINPVFNPYIKGNLIIPLQGAPYIQRDTVVPGMIINNDVVVQTFAQYGWHWGGKWKTLKDYQHFEKVESSY